MAATVGSSCLEASISSATILWDLECCPIPRELGGHQAVRKIKDFVASRNIRINNFTALGNFDLLDTTLKEELQDSAVVLNNVSTQRSSPSMDVAILCEMMKLVYLTKPPHSLILISGDRNFCKAISFLESIHFNVIIFHSCEISDTLRSLIKEAINWNEFLGIGCPDESFHPLDTKSKRFIMKKAVKNTPESNLAVLSTHSNFSSQSCIESSSCSAAFLPLIDYLQVQDSGSQTFINIETSLQGVYYEFGFKSFSDYIKAAEKNGVIVSELHGVGKTIARLHNFGKDLFAKLINFLQSCSEDAVLFSKIGEDCITKKVLAEYGFSSLRPYIEKASRCGIIKIIVNEHGHRLAQLRPNYVIDSKPTNSKHSLKLHIPKHKRGLLIGPHGANVLKLEKDLRVKLTLRDPYCFVSSDDQSLVETAAAYLTSVYRGQTESEQAIKMAAKSLKFEVPGALVGQIKGRKGTKCHELEEEFGVDIDIPKLKATDNGDAEVTITIIGKELNIMKAKERIMDIVRKHGYQQFSQHSFSKRDRTISISTTVNSSEPTEVEDALVSEYHQSTSINYEKSSSFQPMKNGNSLSRTCSSEDSFTFTTKSLDSDQMTLSQSPSVIQAEQEALIPSFLLGNDPEDTLRSTVPISSVTVKEDANAFVRRQKAVLSSLIKIQDEHSRLFSYVNRE